ncbi:MAG: ABC transporter permease subunit [Clostridia bacterium]|nr:ABC transporter permease subunit [Clostridia bacterium]
MMTLYLHELKSNRTSFWVWLVSVAAFCCGTVFLFPMTKESMSDLSDAFASMGGFSSAFGMDKLSVATLEGFFGTEIGTIYALGGGMYASLLGIGMLAKEEGAHTAEFLHTLTMSRPAIVTGKLLASLTLLAAFGLLNFGAMLASIAIVGESMNLTSLTGYMLAQSLCQGEIFAVCFGISAFLRRNNLGVGLGLALVLYVVDIMSRIADETEWMRILTPFGFSNATDIFVNEGKMETIPVVIGGCIAAAGLAAAYAVYGRRDISA